MSGLAMVSQTECKTIMIRLVHNGVVVDRIEVEKVHYMPSEKEVEANEAEYAKKLWEEM